ncbi:MAG: cytochrome C [Betaproteobacteria bacterium]|nr:cytochrome C [Betaproteobacteria bacterium]
MKLFAAVIALALPLYVAPVHASPELAAKSKCMACHDVEKKKLGPSFKDISTKYKMGLGCGKGDAEAMLTEGILKGSKGKWGKIPMPAQKIPPADAQTLSKWILGC